MLSLFTAAAALFYLDIPQKNGIELRSAGGSLVALKYALVFSQAERSHGAASELTYEGDLLRPVSHSSVLLAFTHRFASSSRTVPQV